MSAVRKPACRSTLAPGVDRLIVADRDGLARDVGEGEAVAEAAEPERGIDDPIAVSHHRPDHAEAAAAEHGPDVVDSDLVAEQRAQAALEVADVESDGASVGFAEAADEGRITLLGSGDVAAEGEDDGDGAGGELAHGRHCRRTTAGLATVAVLGVCSPR
jgi:hypothetical protein